MSGEGIEGALWWDHRLVLRYSNREELPDLVRLLGDPVACSWLWFGPLEPAGVNDYFGPILDTQAEALARGEHASMVEFVVHDRRDGAFLGHGAVVAQPEKPGWYELGFALVPSCWGQGVGGRLGRFLVRFAVSELAAAGLEASCLAGNTASRHLLESLGLRLRRTRRAYREMRGVRYDEHFFSAALNELPTSLLMD